MKISEPTVTFCLCLFSDVGKVQRASVACVFVDDDSQIGDRLFYRYVGNRCNITVFEW